MELEIGRRLKVLREKSGLSQRQLSQRTRVANTTISMIEQDKLNPSVALLKRVLDGLDVTMAEFFSIDVDCDTHVFFPAAELVELGGGLISYRQVGFNLEGRSLQMIHERYKVGADTGKTMLSHEGEEAGVVIKGRLEVTVGDQQRVLGPGDAYFFRSRVPHRFRNVGDGVCEVVSSCTPPYF